MRSPRRFRTNPYSAVGSPVPPGILNSHPRESEPDARRVQRIGALKFWTPILSAILGGVSLLAGTFVSTICTAYGPGENGCIGYGYDLLGRAVTIAGLISLLSGLYIIFTPYLGGPWSRRRQ